LADEICTIINELHIPRQLEESAWLVQFDNRTVNSLWHCTKRRKFDSQYYCPENSEPRNANNL